MRQALIIGTDGPASDPIEARLHAAGYARIAHAFTAEDAWAAACRKPDIVIVLANFGAPVDVETLYGIAQRAEAPILVATSSPSRATRCLGDGAVLDGPCELVPEDIAAA